MTIWGEEKNTDLLKPISHIWEERCRNDSGEFYSHS